MSTGGRKLILVIGKENCSRCEITKNVLNQKGIEFEYKKFEELEKEEATKFKKMSMEAKLMSFPIIIKDNKVISLQEV